MAYDFHSTIERRDGSSLKWDQMLAYNRDLPDDVIPLTVADMELKNAPEIMEGLRVFLDHEITILGYTGPPESYTEAVVHFLATRHAWDIERDWIVNTAGVVPAFYLAVQAFSRPGEGVIMMSPVYHPFFFAAEQFDRHVVNCPLIDRDGHYEINWALFEQLASDPVNTTLLFCSPHNPVGRVWTEMELRRLGDICLRHDVLVLSDEIHFDMVLPGHRHIVYATLGEEYAQRSITFSAPSKTFNLAGLKTSYVIIPDERIRENFKKHMRKISAGSPTILGFKACEIAYTKCLDWLDQVIDLIDKNRRYVENYCQERIPEIKPYPMEGTYLQWLDCSSLQLNHDQLMELLWGQAYFFATLGRTFGEGGEGFVRVNLACPTSYLESALKRLDRVIRSR
ncbi:MAG: pyridoxal phosphate-dependent aminotransferase [Clostridiaceae bacterium]|nr:pyridoxal phosphate-dependent aminotransferase [Clostridiaceae bacterium]